jgi:hypothetical protein
MKKTRKKAGWFEALTIGTELEGISLSRLKRLYWFMTAVVPLAVLGFGLSIPQDTIKGVSREAVIALMEAIAGLYLVALWRFNWQREKARREGIRRQQERLGASRRYRQELIENLGKKEEQTE